MAGIDMAGINRVKPPGRCLMTFGRGILGFSAIFFPALLYAAAWIKAFTIVLSKFRAGDFIGSMTLNDDLPLVHDLQAVMASEEYGELFGPR